MGITQHRKDKTMTSEQFNKNVQATIAAKLKRIDNEREKEADTTFNNVTITIPSVDSREAYARLCSALASIDAEWQTDTYTNDETDDRFRPVCELYPELN